MTEENDVVIARRYRSRGLEKRRFLDAVFCDVFEMKNSKIKRLVTYQVNLTSSRAARSDRDNSED